MGQAQFPSLAESWSPKNRVMAVPASHTAVKRRCDDDKPVAQIRRHQLGVVRAHGWEEKPSPAQRSFHLPGMLLPGQLRICELVPRSLPRVPTPDSPGQQAQMTVDSGASKDEAFHYKRGAFRGKCQLTLGKHLTDESRSALSGRHLL